MVDDAARIRAFLPQLDEIVEEGLVMIDEVEVIKYVGRKHEQAATAHPGVSDRE
ncbi:MAG TPA: DUF190 domain-containing protein [Actinocrinis sp.]